MRRGPKLAKSKEAKPSVARNSPKDESARVRDLEKRLEEALHRETEGLKREAEAQDQQTAISEILRVISSSQMDLQPVLEGVVKSATRFCGAHDAELYRLDGTDLKVVAHHGPISAPMGRLIPVVRGTVAGRAALERRAVHVADLQAEPEEFPVGYTLAREFGYRTVVSVPLLREGKAIGTINLRRTDVSPFTEAQIALAQTFANQAVIAIENVRLFSETKEALEQQTATSEILRVISNSPTDIQPVVDSIAAKALDLCEAKTGAVFRFDGELIHVVAAHSFSPEAVEAHRQTYPIPPGRGGTTARAILSRAVVYIPDIREDSEYEHQVLAKATDYLSALSVPMLHESEPVGAITVTRAEAGAFSQRQIELLKTFADQAVIAIENVRLFKELEARNRDLTATSEILRVISSSPTDAQPVFDAIAASATRLCDGVYSVVFRYDGEVLTVAADDGRSAETSAVIRSAYPAPPGRQTLARRALFERRVIAMTNAQDSGENPDGAERARALGYRAGLSVPMMRGDVAIGVINVVRMEAIPFSDTQIALLQTFADQAVIAIENVRLFKELQTSNRDLTIALDKQTATSDILSVISRSQTDVQPVFDAIVNSAVRLLRGYSALVTRVAGDQIELAAYTSTGAEGDAVARATYPVPLQNRNSHGQAIHARTTLNIADAQTDARLPEASHAMARARGFHGQVVLPLLRHDEALGAIGVSRREPGEFTDDEIALLQTFADQAVIAIENVRLFKELEARTHDLTRSVGKLQALGEVGQAISSTLDLQTVLGTIVGRAVQLSESDAGVIYEYNEEREVFVPRATEHLEAEILETMLATPVRKGEGATGRLAEAQEPIQVPDILAAPAESRVRGALVRAGYRALLAVPLVREGGCSAVSQ